MTPCDSLQFFTEKIYTKNSLDLSPDKIPKKQIPNPKSQFSKFKIHFPLSTLHCLNIKLTNPELTNPELTNQPIPISPPPIVP